MKKMTKAMLMTALIIGAVQWGGTPVHAEELNTFALDEYVVTATRYEKRAVDVAASVEVFDQERLQATGASNLYEAMQYGTGLMIQQYGSGGSSMGNMTSKVAIRGNSNGTLVLVNGVPINIRGTYDLNDIPIENVERVEVVRGGGSVLYGSDATGGVINIITKKERQNYVKAAVGNYGQQEYVASVQADKLGFSYKYSKWGEVENVGINKKTGEFDRDWEGPENNNFELTYKFNDNLSLMASHNESKYNYLTTIGKSAMGKWTPANDTEQNVKRNNIQLTYQDDTFKATAYYLDRDREKDGKLLADGGFYNHDDEKSKNYGLDLQKSFDIKDATLLVGATYQNENYQSSEIEIPWSGSDVTSAKPATAPDSNSTNGSWSRDNYSVYAQYDRKLSKANSVILSARETWTANSDGKVSEELDNFSGQVQFIHKLSENESLYASAGQSFKMPALYQYYKTGAESNAQLEPQEGTHYEIGWKKDIDDNRSLRVALFDYEVENNISATWDTKKHKFTYSNENIKNTGIEAEYSLTSTKGFGYNVSASYGNPKTQSIDKNNHNFGWQEDNNKFELKAGLTYRMDKWKAAMNAAYVTGRHGFKTTSESTRNGKTTPASVSNFDAKSYLLTNLNIEYQAQKDLSFFATINNIFDRDDVVFFSDSAEYYCTPVNSLIGMKYSF